MNALELTNVIITGNAAEGGVNQSAGGGIWACPWAEVEVYSTVGGAIYGNTADDGDDFVFEGEDTAIQYILTGSNQSRETSHMSVSSRSLGGGQTIWYEDYRARVLANEEDWGKTLEELGGSLSGEETTYTGQDYVSGTSEPANSSVYTNATRTFGLHGELSEAWAELAAETANTLVIKDNKATGSLYAYGGGIATNSPIIIGMKDHDVSVTVTKTWSEAEHPESATVTLVRVDEDGNQVDLETVTLSEENNWSYTFEDLPSLYEDENGDPCDYTYTVREAPISGWESTVGAMTPVAGEDNAYTIALTNEPKTVTLRVMKNVTDENADPDKEYNFTVKIGDETHEITLKDDGYQDFPDLTVGTEYEVIETDSQGYETAYNGYCKGTISDDSPEFITAVVTNTLPTEGVLFISKTVNGGGSQSRQFTFTVTLTDEAGEALEGTYQYSGSKTGTIASGGTVTLSSGQSISINNLPDGTRYTVTEAADDDYDTTISGHDATDPYYGSTATGTIIAGAGATAHYTNTYDPDDDYDPPSRPSRPSTDNDEEEEDERPEDLNTEDHVAYIIGYTDGLVRPEGSIARSEVATIFFRLLTDEARETYWSQSNPYSDVDIDDWYNNAISTLTNMGILDGYPDGTFRPTDPITRSEFTKIAVSFFDYADENFRYDGRFSDVEGDEWYANFLAAAVEYGLIEGLPDGTFRPLADITRAEACTIVNRTLGREPHEDHLLPWREMITWPDNENTDAWYYAAMQEATNSHDYTWITLDENDRDDEDDDEVVEEWIEKLEERDWAALERAWSEANDAPGGEVMD